MTKIKFYIGLIVGLIPIFVMFYGFEFNKYSFIDPETNNVVYVNLDEEMKTNFVAGMQMIYHGEKIGSFSMINREEGKYSINYVKLSSAKDSLNYIYTVKNGRFELLRTDEY